MKYALPATMAILAAATIYTAAQADGFRSGGPRSAQAAMIQTLDTNADGIVTLDEALEAQSATLERHDSDGDGTLSLAEFAALDAERNRERMVDAFQRLDADGDATVTLAEMNRPIEALTARLDRDGDGDIDQNDRPAHREAHRERPDQRQTD